MRTTHDGWKGIHGARPPVQNRRANSEVNSDMGKSLAVAKREGDERRDSICLEERAMNSDKVLKYISALGPVHRKTEKSATQGRTDGISPLHGWMG